MNKVASLDLTKNQTCFIVVVLSIKFVNYFRKLFYENLRQLLPTVISNECKWPTETSWSEIDKRKELKSSNTKNGHKFKIIYLSHHHVLCFFSKIYILWFLKTSRDVKARIKKIIDSYFYCHWEDWRFILLREVLIWIKRTKWSHLFYRIAALKKFAIFKGKYLRRRPFLEGLKA